MIKKGAHPPITADLLSLFHDINGHTMVVNVEDGVPMSETAPSSTVFTYGEYRIWQSKHLECCGEFALAPQINFVFTKGDPYDDENHDAAVRAAWNFSSFNAMTGYAAELTERLWDPLLNVNCSTSGISPAEYYQSMKGPKYSEIIGKKFKAAGGAVGWHLWMSDCNISGGGKTAEYKIWKEAIKEAHNKNNAFYYKPTGGNGAPSVLHYRRIGFEDNYNLLPEIIRQEVVDCFAEGLEWSLYIEFTVNCMPAFWHFYKPTAWNEPYYAKPMNFTTGDWLPPAMTTWSPSGISIPEEYSKNTPCYTLKVAFPHDPNNCTFCSQTGYVLDESQVHQKLLEVIK